MQAAILSPHCDDAAFSCGLTMLALLQAGTAVTVVNVFTRSNYAVDLSTVDVNLPLIEAVSEARLREDKGFLADIAQVSECRTGAARLHDLAWLDAPLRLTVPTEAVLNSPLSEDQVAAEAEALAKELSFLTAFDFVFVPLALGDHIDHRVAREAAVRLLPPDRVCWYEDLPYAARMPVADCTSASLRAVSSKGAADFRRYALQLAEGSHLKRKFAMHYPSQISPEVADEMAIYAARWADHGEGAERWWAKPATAERLRCELNSAGAVGWMIQEQG